MTYRIAFPLLALLAAGACNTKDATAPMSQAKTLSVSAAGRDASDDGQDFPRAGTFHAEKNCDQYSGLAGGFCTITVSTLKQIPVGTRVVYQDAATATAVITDLMLVPPNPGNNVAFGHVDLNRVTRTGTATFSGGTGKFQHFTASVVISYCSAPSQCAVLNGRNWAWDGTYSFGNNGEGN
jgi:hypothetical protein